VLYHNHYERLRERRRPKPQRLTWKRGSTPNLWIYGPTGTGKSHKARELYPEHYEKMLNKWWDRYDDEECALIEDVGESHAAWIGDFLKIWADIYPFRMEVKGDSKMIRPKIVIVTSNYHPKDLFPNPKVHLPILDRFQLMQLTEKYEDPTEGPLIRDIVQRDYPFFEVVKDMFSVEKADDIPRNSRGPVIDLGSSSDDEEARVLGFLEDCPEGSVEEDINVLY